MINTGKFKYLLRPAMLSMTFVLGIGFQMWSKLSWKTHDGNSISLWLIRCSLMIMFYLVLLKIDFSKLIPRREHFTILAANLAMGIVPYAVLKYLGYDTLALAAFFVGITPTANAAPVVMDFLEGNVEFVLAGFVITNFFIDIALVGLLPWVTGNFNCSFLLDVAGQIALVVVFPLVCAALTKFICRRLNKKVFKTPGMVTFTIWCGSLFVISAQSTLFFQQHREVSMNSVLLISLLSFIICALNFTAGKFAGAGNFRRETAQTLGQKNTTLTIFLALTFGTPESALGPTFYVLWHNLWNACQMYRHDLNKTATLKEKK